MRVKVREMGHSDRALWAQMRGWLWPEDPPDVHVQWVDEIIHDPDYRGFVAETEDGVPIGFAKIAIRKYANGCLTHPVPFVEAIFVEPTHRRKRVATELLAFIEGLLIAQGFREIGSDARVENAASHAAHRGWGFEETERVVYFRKSLGPGDT